MSVEVDETNIGGKVPKMNKEQRRKWKEKHGKGTGGTGKILVAALRERETNIYHISIVDDTSKESLQPFVQDNTAPSSTIIMDEGRGYIGLDEHDRAHETVKHKEDEYVRYVLNGSTLSVNGVESMWFTFKTSILGTHHHIFGKHLAKCLNQLAGRYNRRNLGTLSQMNDVAKWTVGRHIKYKDLSAEREVA